MTYPAFPSFVGRPDFPIKRSPRWSSLRQTAISGRETLQPLWSAPIWDYELTFSMLNGTANSLGQTSAGELQTMVGFFNTVMASASGVFAYDDPQDDTASDEGFGAGDGATTQFQLTRAYGGFAEPVLNPAAPAPNTPGTDLDYGNCTTSPTTDYDYGNCTVSPSTDLDYGYCSSGFFVYAAGDLAAYTLCPGGIVTIDPAPADDAALTWTGTYTWLCRFSGAASGATGTSITLDTEQFMYQLYDLKSVKFSTIHL